LVFLEMRAASRLVLFMDTMFFLGLLFVYKLFLFKLYTGLMKSESKARQLNRSLLASSLLLAPLSFASVASLRHGGSVWSLDGNCLYLWMLGLTTFIRPVMVLLNPIAPAEHRVNWLWREGPKLAFSTLVGSGLLVLAALMADQRGIGRGDILLDTVVFGLLITLQGLHLNAKALAREDPQDGKTVQKKLLIIGQGLELSAYLAAFCTMPPPEVVIVGILTPSGHGRYRTVGGHAIIGELIDLEVVVDSMKVNQVVVLATSLEPDHIAYLEKQPALKKCAYRFLNFSNDLKV